jgi:hypothetical protein
MRARAHKRNKKRKNLKNPQRSVSNTQRHPLPRHLKTEKLQFFQEKTSTTAKSTQNFIKNIFTILKTYFQWILRQQISIIDLFKLQF